MGSRSELWMATPIALWAGMTRSQMGTGQARNPFAPPGALSLAGSTPPKKKAPKVSFQGPPKLKLKLEKLTLGDAYAGHEVGGERGPSIQVDIRQVWASRVKSLMMPSEAAPAAALAKVNPSTLYGGVRCRCRPWSGAQCRAGASRVGWHILASESHGSVAGISPR